MPPEAHTGPSGLPACAAAESQELQARSQLALDAAGVGTWVWDVTSDTLIWDHVTYRLFGVRPSEFTVRRDTMEKLIHPEDRIRVRTEVACCLESGADIRTEYRIVWPGDGSVHHLRARGRVYRDPSGRTTLTGACWDITERKGMEADLARERFLLQTLMETIPDQIYFKDEQSRFIRISSAMIGRFSVSDASEVIGKTDFDFFSQQHAQQAFEDEQRIIRTGRPLLDIEERETWQDGHETWVSTTKLPLRDGHGRIIGTCGVSRDITDKRHAEEQLAHYADELRRRNTELEEDLAMARELQRALMPRSYPCFPHDAAPRESALRFSHFFNPSAAVSGDFFDILQLSDTTAGVFICDVMGHGMRAALVAAIVRALVEEHKDSGEAPAEFLDKLNRKLCAILKQADIPMFISASYVVADLARNELRYANAGHPDPLCIRHEASVARAQPLNHCKRGPVLGMFERAQYGASACALSPHDMVLLFTDGLFEVEGAGGELYDQAHLLRAVNRRANLHANELCREVLTEVQQFSANKQFSDDVCLVAVEVERLAS